MDPKMAVLLGFAGGIILFFVLERTGLLYKWFDK